MNMRTSLLAAAGLFGAIQLQAQAGCVEDIHRIEPQISSVANPAKKDRAQGDISRAMDQADMGHEKACMDYLMQAKRVSGIR